MSALSSEAILAGLAVEVVGRDITCLTDCDSTNNRARAAAAAGAADGTAVFSETQTAGRGQRGRVWLDTAGSCLLLSVVLRPDVPPGSAYLLTMLAACATAASVEEITRLSCPLKWPNDLTLAGRKVAGVLVETSIVSDRLDFAVVGIGLNVRLDASSFPEISGTATSLAAELGADVDRVVLARELLSQLDLRYGWLRRGQGDLIRSEWQRRLDTLGRRVRLIDERGQEEAVVAEDVAADGALLARRDDGSLRVCLVGEVSLTPAGER